MNDLESRMIGGINSSMQNRIALVDERFISEASGSFVSSVTRTIRIALPIVARSVSELKFRSRYSVVPIRHFLICAQIFVRWVLSPLIGSSPGGKWPPPDVFLRHERLCRSDGFGLPT